MKVNKEIPPSSIKPGETHVWLFDLNRPDYKQQLWERFLAEEEINRSKLYKYAQDRLRFIARRGILRRLLGRYCVLNPAEINYRNNPYGKLFLLSNPLSFSLSHSEDRIAFAFTLENAVGVDIEQVRPFPDISLMVENWFSSEEQAGLFALAPEVQFEAFYHIWTQKESYLKAHGEGLTLSLKDFSVSVDPDKPGGLISFRGVSEDTYLWKTASNVPEAGWRVAVCVNSEADINVNWYTPDLAEFLSWVTSASDPLL